MNIGQPSVAPPLIVNGKEKLASDGGLFAISGGALNTLIQKASDQGARLTVPDKSADADDDRPLSEGIMREAENREENDRESERDR